MQRIGLLVFGSFVLTLASAHGQETATRESDRTVNFLPERWCGTWAGKLTVHMHDGTQFDKPMELQIELAKGPLSYRWRIESELGGRRSVRDYRLVPACDVKGHFKIDEQNGIVLDSWLLGNTLYTYYKDGDILITGRHELRDEGLLVELASVETASPHITSPTGADFEIQSYQLGSLQTGVLQRERASR